MPLIKTPDAEIYFAHCPKAGGTSVETYLLDRYGQIGLYARDWEKDWLAGGWRDGSARVSPQHLAWVAAEARMDRKPDHIFAVVRDPLSRLLSEYRYQARSFPPRPHAAWRTRLRRLGFSAWLRIMLRAARIAPHVFDNHIRPQVDFFPETATLFQLENGLDQVVDWLNTVDPGTATDYGIGHEMKPKRPSNPVTLSSQDIALIAHYYAADYALLGYTPPDPATAPHDILAPARDTLAILVAPLVVRMFERGKL